MTDHPERHRLDAAARGQYYRRQNGSRKITPRQRRRIAQKFYAGPTMFTARLLSP